MTLSLASSNSFDAINRLPRRAASSAASLQRLARKARCAAGNAAQIDVGCQRLLAGVNLEDFLAPVDVGARHDDLAVETTRAEQRGVEHVGAVGRRDDDDAFIGLEAVHFDEQLIERLFALVIAIAQARTAVAADRVDFVDEDDARRVTLGLFEHVTDAAGTDADEHLDEVGARNGEEGHAGFTRNRAGEQGLAGAGRPDEQRALGNLAAEFREFGRVLQELDDLLQLFARLVDAGDVVEGYPPLLFGEHFRARLAKAHRARSVAFLHLAKHEESNAQDEDERQRLDEQKNPDIACLGGLAVIFDAIVVEQLEQFGIADQICAEWVAVRQRAGGAFFGQHDVLDAALDDLFAELGIGQRGARGLRRTAEHRGDEEHGKQNADHHALHPGVALRFLVVLHAESFPIVACFATIPAQDRTIALNDNEPVRAFSVLSGAAPPKCARSCPQGRGRHR